LIASVSFPVVVSNRTSNHYREKPPPIQILAAPAYQSARDGAPRSG